MARFDHLTLPVADWVRARDFYAGLLHLTVELEAAAQGTVALQDSRGFTIFFQETAAATTPEGVALYFNVADVEAVHGELLRAGAEVSHGPRKVRWGYGLEVRDPDGYVLRLWDERSMLEHGH